MDNKTINNFLKFLKKEVTPTIKKDVKWLSKAISNDLEKLTKNNETSKKKDK